ncbi:MAG: P-loop NTPase fold protein [Cytophagales bacterium]|nr:P-loop NTPase fold protein [Cytophagales bacterium]
MSSIFFELKLGKPSSRNTLVSIILGSADGKIILGRSPKTEQFDLQFKRETHRFGDVITLLDGDSIPVKSKSYLPEPAKGVIVLITEPIPSHDEKGSGIDIKSVVNNMGGQLANIQNTYNIPLIELPLFKISGLTDKEVFTALLKGYEINDPEKKMDIFVESRRTKELLKRVDLDLYDSNGNFTNQKVQNQVQIQMVADRPIDDVSNDKLDFKTFSNALAGIIDSPNTTTPLTLVINAPWGAGKSSLGNLIRRQVEAMPAKSLSKHRTIWFNAWQHDDSEHIKTAFTAFIARELDQYRRWWHKLWDPLPVHLTAPSDRFARRIRNVSLYGVLTLLLFGLFKLVEDLPEIQTILKGLPPELADYKGIAVGGTGALVIKIFQYLFQFTSTLKSYLKDPIAEAQAGKVEVVRNQLKGLINQALPKDLKLVIFVDDLERCRDTGPVELMEAINQLLNIPNVIIVIMADIQTVAASADIKYEEFAKRYNPAKAQFGPSTDTDGENNNGFGRLYIQKIIQLQFDLPLYNPKHIRPLVENQEAKTADELTKLPENANEENIPFQKRIFRAFTKFIKTQYTQFEAILGSTIEERMVSFKEVSGSEQISVALKPLYLILWIGMFPIILISRIFKGFYRDYWNINLDTFHAPGLKRINAFLILLFIISSFVMYGLLAHNSWMDLRYQNQFNPQHIEAYLDTLQISENLKEAWQMEINYEIFGPKENQDSSKLFTIEPSDSTFSYADRVTWKYLWMRKDEFANVSISLAMGIADQTAELDELFVGGWLSSLFNRDIIPHEQRLTEDSVFVNKIDSLYGAFALLDSIGTFPPIKTQTFEATNLYVNRYIYEVYRNATEGYRTISIELTLLFLLVVIVYQLLTITWVSVTHEDELSSYSGQVNDKMKKNQSHYLDDDNSNLNTLEIENIRRTEAYANIEQNDSRFHIAIKHTLDILKLVLPRNVKRVSNKLRLLFNIAYERKILDKLDPIYFSKWVALQEAYPELVSYISRSIEEMESIEQLCLAVLEEEESNAAMESDEVHLRTVRTKFNKFFGKIQPSYYNDLNIAHVITYTDPEDQDTTYHLSDKINLLVYFQE